MNTRVIKHLNLLLTRLPLALVWVGIHFDFYIMGVYYGRTCFSLFCEHSSAFHFFFRSKFYNRNDEMLNKFFFWNDEHSHRTFNGTIVCAPLPFSETCKKNEKNLTSIRSLNHLLDTDGFNLKHDVTHKWHLLKPRRSSPLYASEKQEIHTEDEKLEWPWYINSREFATTGVVDIQASLLGFPC